MQRIATLTTQLRSLVRTAEMERFALKKRQLLKLMSQGQSFGVISAYGSGSKSENKRRRTELIQDLQKGGLKVVPLKGSWDGVAERSVLVKNIKADKLFQLGRKYEQDSVIFKSDTGTLGMYNLKDRTVDLAVNPKGDPVFEMATDKSLYSKARGLSFEFGFLWGQSLPWKGSSPVSKKQLKKIVEQKLDFAKKD